MILSSIPSGAAVFVDANVFVYWFADDPNLGDACSDFLERIESGDLLGFVSAALLSDVAHRLMTLEACDSFGWPYAGVGRRLKRTPSEVGRLTRFRTALDEIANLVQVLDITGSHVLRAGDLSRQHGLLSGDALIVAVMESHHLSTLASNDSDFDRVPGIARYSVV